VSATSPLILIASILTARTPAEKPGEDGDTDSQLNSTTVSRAVTPSFASSSSSGIHDQDMDTEVESENIDDAYGLAHGPLHSDAGSDDDKYQEAVTSSLDPPRHHHCHRMALQDIAQFPGLSQREYGDCLTNFKDWLGLSGDENLFALVRHIDLIKPVVHPCDSTTTSRIPHPASRIPHPKHLTFSYSIQVPRSY